MSKRALEGVKVVELAQFITGPYCTKLLADLGAEVIKIEPVGTGDASRRRGPFSGNIPHPETSALFLYLNSNKYGITLDIRTSGGKEKFRKLIENADILVEDTPPKTLTDLGLDWEILKKINPGLVMTTITPFGLWGPYASYKSYPLNSYQSSLMGYMTPLGSPHKNRGPLKSGGMLGEYGSGVSAAIATTAALLYQRITNEGQHIDVSKQETLIAFQRTVVAQQPNEGVSESRLSKKTGGLEYVLPCKDGHFVFQTHRDNIWQALVRLMGNPEWTRHNEYDKASTRLAHYENEIRPKIIEWASQFTRNELYHQGQAIGCSIAPVLSAADVTISEQMQSREFFLDVNHSIAGQIQYPSGPFKLSQTPCSIVRPAPCLGEHNEEIFDRLIQTQNNGNKKTELKLNSINEKKTLPLEGVRIADLSTAVAGAYIGSILASLGAQVIRIESRARIDPSRMYTLTTSTGKFYNDPDHSMSFNDVNLGKLSANINLSTERGIELAKDLIRTCDVVIQNMRPGVMEKLGLGYDELQKIKPEIIMLSSSARGQTGPERSYIGFAPNFSALSGLSYTSGYPDGKPASFPTEIDLISAHTSAFAILTAIHHWRRTGEGQLIDVSSTDTISVLLGEEFLDYSMNGHVQPRNGNYDPMMAPHGCYRCTGEDKWVSIAIATEEEWLAFCQTIGSPDWTSDHHFADLKSRQNNGEELDKLIENWTINFTHNEIMQILQAKGVAAIPSFNSQELYNDPHLKARDFWVEVEHPVIGKQTVIAPPWKLSATPAAVHRHGPLMGEHNQFVFGKLLGISPVEIEKLIDEKVIY